MIERQIADWDDAYSNGPNIPGGDRWPALWVEPARAFREAMRMKSRARLDLAYGDKPRNRLDLFLPIAKPIGLVVFVHGGFWQRLDKSYWSHFATGAVDSGYAVAIPSYTLCPDIRISGIATEIATAISMAASEIDGPIILVGHSAGGQLVTRMVTTTTPLAPRVQSRVRNVVSISGLHDLRPLMYLSMNGTLAIDEAEALSESPVLLRPIANTRLTCWVGGNERAEFLRQNALLGNIWTGLGAATRIVVEEDRHHFNIFDGLESATHPLTRTLLEVGGVATR